jgi:predicted DNA-binding WGR domain protein
LAPIPSHSLRFVINWGKKARNGRMYSLEVGNRPIASIFEEEEEEEEEEEKKKKNKKRRRRRKEEEDHDGDDDDDEAQVVY